MVNEKEGAEKLFVGSNMNHKNNNVGVEILPGGKNSADKHSIIYEDQIYLNQQDNLKNKNNEASKEFGLNSHNDKKNIPSKLTRSTHGLLRQGGGGGDGRLAEGRGRLPLGRRAAQAARAALRSLLGRGRSKRS